MYAKFVPVNHLYVLACASKLSITKSRFLLYYSFYFHKREYNFYRINKSFFLSLYACYSHFATLGILSRLLKTRADKIFLKSRIFKNRYFAEQDQKFLH